MVPIEFNVHTRRRIHQYLTHAHQAVSTGRLNLGNQDYIAAVNRAYYAIFYAANALLTTKGLERSRHSGVLAAFRQHFVKTGLVEPEYSDIFGETMDDRHAGDYELTEFGFEVASRSLDQADRFLQRVEQVLRDMGALE